MHLPLKPVPQDLISAVQAESMVTSTMAARSMEPSAVEALVGSATPKALPWHQAVTSPR